MTVMEIGLRSGTGCGGLKPVGRKMYPCYLDIDGVLDDVHAWGKWRLTEKPDRYLYLELLSDRKIQILNRLEGLVQIIVSSSWRLECPYPVEELLREKGLRIPIIGRTPDMSVVVGGWMSFGSGYQAGLRAREIATHAKSARYRFDRLVVIDDEPTATRPGLGYPKIGSCFIKTRSCEGLTDSHIDWGLTRIMRWRQKDVD